MFKKGMKPEEHPNWKGGISWKFNRTGYARGKHPNCRKSSPFIKGHKPFAGSEKTQFKKGSKAHLGYKVSEDSKKIMSLKKLKKDSKLKLTLRSISKYLEWRSAVFQRDGWTCQTCGKRGTMEAHHKKEFHTIIEENNIQNLEQAINCSELWDINNGVTLCVDCHKLIKSKRRKNI